MIRPMLVCVIASTVSAFAGGRIVVDNDEWTLSDTGFRDEGTSNGFTYARNAARFLTGRSARAAIWINSSNFSFNGTGLKSALADYDLLSTGTFASFTLADLKRYHAVFLGGDTLTATEQLALVSYIQAGGGAYIAGGTGTILGGGPAEAAQWNVVLNAFGLNFASAYNGIEQIYPTPVGSPVLRGVTELYYNNGNTVSATGKYSQIIASLNGQGLIGTYSGDPSDGDNAPK